MEHEKIINPKKRLENSLVDATRNKMYDIKLERETSNSKTHDLPAFILTISDDNILHKL